MADIEGVRAFLGDDVDKYRGVLYEALKTDRSYLNSVNKYILGNRGKEMRPLLSLLVGRCCGTLTEASYCCAAVSEMLHTATLLHDDVVDQASKRRNAPTVGALFTPYVAVLTGDFWLSVVLAVLASKCDRKIINLFTDATKKLSEGELLQIDKADEMDTTEEDYFIIIYGKTAVLFEATVKAAAYAVNAPQPVVDGVASFAKYLGLAFQIRDDIFDYSPSMETGKNFGIDLKERKITLPLLGAFKNAPEKRGEVIAKIKELSETVCTPEREKQIVEDVFNFVNESGGLEYAQNVANQYLTMGIKGLDVLPDSPDKQMLIEFAEFVCKRKK